jgi:TrpR family transcriptional regulator, trp operon repressor
VIEDLFTPAEIVEMADRIQILKMLSEGKSQRDIAEELGISVTTVSRGNRVLQYERKSIHKYI